MAHNRLPRRGLTLRVARTHLCTRTRQHWFRLFLQCGCCLDKFSPCLGPRKCNILELYIGYILDLQHYLAASSTPRCNCNVFLDSTHEANWHIEDTIFQMSRLHNNDLSDRYCMHLMSWYTQYYMCSLLFLTRTPMQLNKLDNQHTYPHLYSRNGICG